MFWEMWDRFTTAVMAFGMPIVYFYHLITGSPFMNVAAEDAKGLEKLGNEILTPIRYLLSGREAHKMESFLSREGEPLYQFKQQFTYKENFWLNTCIALKQLPLSLTVGGSLKALSYLSPETRNRHQKIALSDRSCFIRLHNDYYRSVGIELKKWEEMEPLESVVHKRRPGDEKHLAADKKALKEVIFLLKQYDIPFWLDCGTCLGAYRYRGVIPWDMDVDVAILQPDFHNVKNVLVSHLDPSKYDVQDWSSRDKPYTYLKVYVKESKSLIDIYHFTIDPKTKTISHIVSNLDCCFMVNSWKIRESRFTVPIDIDVIFPLRKTTFDGIEVLVPNKTKEYLQCYYGKDLDPAKVYSEITGNYEKDLSHPYWQRAHVH